MRKIRILLVDDEVKAIRHFKRIMEDTQEEYEFVGEALNGKEALALLKTQKPDIIFADICMPVMGGLELAERVKAGFPAVKVILLTAYKDFSYVQQGLHSGVAWYLVKHEITREQVEEIIQKTYRALELERRKERTYFERNVCDFLLSKSGDVNSGETLNYKNNNFIILNVVMKRPLNLCGNMNEEIDLSVGDFEEKLHTDAMYCKAAVRMSPSTCAIILFVKKTIYENTCQYYQQVILNTIWSYLHEKQLDSVIFVSKILKKFSDLPTAYQKLRGYENYIYGMENKVVFWEEMDTQNLDDGCLLGLKEQLFEENESEKEHMQQLEQFFYYGRRCCTIEQYLNFLNDIVTRSIQTAERLRIVETDRWKQLRKESFSDLEKLERWIREICENVWHAQYQEKQVIYSDRMARAVAYIKDAYDSPVTSEEISDYLQISESYFRKIFREELGMKPTEYLNQYRIEKAMELLRENNCRIQDVYEKVGFSSSQHFSKVFKKIAGCSPWQFQRMKRREKE
ncbi:MAG: response regulator [Lachnospiraceae bacterium]|nr:response regulator [Lachnospiraceae bacterium]